MDRVAIVGAGNLGSRHLQAMALTTRHTEITVIDPSMESLEIAKSRWNEMEENPLVSVCKFTTNIEEAPAQLDVAVIATSSGPRRMVVESLLSRSEIKYLIIEKVLFQDFESYESVGNLLKKQKVAAWVNCGRRRTSFYRKLRNLLLSEESVSMVVTGGNWGLGCNSIHMLDLYAFLTGQSEFKADNTCLDNEIIDSKRKGYIEFTGKLFIQSSKGGLSLISYKNGKRPLSISIDSENFHIDIDERNLVARILRRNDDDWKWEKWIIDGRPQSRITQEIVQEIMESGKCGLTTYSESVSLHKVILESFLDHMTNIKKEQCYTCPIT